MPVVLAIFPMACQVSFDIFTNIELDNLAIYGWFTDLKGLLIDQRLK